MKICWIILAVVTVLMLQASGGNPPQPCGATVTGDEVISMRHIANSIKSKP